MSAKMPRALSNLSGWPTQNSEGSRALRRPPGLEFIKLNEKGLRRFVVWMPRLRIANLWMLVRM